MSLLLSINISFFSLAESLFFPQLYPKIQLNEVKDAGEPLFITPFLKKNDILTAQDMSSVPFTEQMGFKSHAGFFTVDENKSSNMYFWYFPAFSGNKEAPVVLWLQGGPGATSLFGLFTELGPLVAKKDKFALRKYHWALNNHLIFIDNPVGTGFSFTKQDSGYCNDENCIAKNLYSCMVQFYTLFPHLQNNEFFITGESYAGKYIPSLAMYIHEQNSLKPKVNINLKGLAMGNAYCDPINQLNYGEYLYQHGLIDDNQLELFNDLQNLIKSALAQSNWVAADLYMDQLLGGDFHNFTYFKNFTGFNSYNNFLQTEDPEDMTIYADLLNNEKVRKDCHVGGLPFNSGKEVQLHLVMDFLQSVAHTIEKLLSHYRILFYNGQLDIIVAYPLTVNFLRNLIFSSALEYHVAKRKIWRVGNDVAGYVKKAGNLTEILVRDAGHMVPHDQPKWALDMITKFIQNKF